MMLQMVAEYLSLGRKLNRLSKQSFIDVHGRPGTRSELRHFRREFEAVLANNLG